LWDIVLLQWLAFVLSSGFETWMSLHLWVLDTYLRFVSSKHASIQFRIFSSDSSVEAFHFTSPPTKAMRFHDVQPLWNVSSSFPFAQIDGECFEKNTNLTAHSLPCKGKLPPL
jgi:hypothetical protein